MEDIKQYLDSTYLKLPEQAGLSYDENLEVVKAAIQEAIAYGFKLIMIRPDMVTTACSMIKDAGAAVDIGTVIDFPYGEGGLETKLAQAAQAIADGADDLDFVADYNAYKRGEYQKVEEEIVKCTNLGLASGRVVKWIIEVAALTDVEIKGICNLIKGAVTASADVEDYRNVFVKSSTGFYKTEDGKPNGATPETIKIMLESAAPLPVKAAGGVRNFSEAVAMIKLGVKRIGTSSARAIVEGEPTSGGY